MTLLTRHQLLSLSVMSALSISVAACHNDPTSLPPGEYERSSESTDQYGTKTTRDTNVDVRVDEYGNKKADVKQTTTKDPKGLFNKTSTTKEQTVREY